MLHNKHVGCSVTKSESFKYWTLQYQCKLVLSTMADSLSIMLSDPSRGNCSWGSWGRMVSISWLHSGYLQDMPGFTFHAVPVRNGYRRGCGPYLQGKAGNQGIYVFIFIHNFFSGSTIFWEALCLRHTSNLPMRVCCQDHRSFLAVHLIISLHL